MQFTSSGSYEDDEVRDGGSSGQPQSTSSTSLTTPILDYSSVTCTTMSKGVITKNFKNDSQRPQRFGSEYTTTHYHTTLTTTTTLHKNYNYTNMPSSYEASFRKFYGKYTNYLPKS